MSSIADLEERRGRFVKSADRVLDLLEYLAGSRSAPTFGQIATALGIPKSSLSQLLGNLLARHYVKLDPDTATYRLGDKLVEIGNRAMALTPFRDFLRRTLERLRDDFNETAAFYVRRGDEAEVMESIGSRHALVFMITVGDRTPLYAHSAGKVLLAQMPEPEFQAYLDRITLETLTPHTIRSGEVLRRQVERARHEGFAYAFEELATGIKGMSAPVVAGGRLFGAVNVAVPAVRYTSGLESAVKARLPRVAAEIGNAALVCGFDPQA